MDLGLYGRGIKPRGGSGASDLKREDVHAAVGRQPEIEAGADRKFPEPHVLIAMRRSREDDGRRVAALVRERQAAPQSARGVSYALASTEQAAPMLPVARHSAGGGVGRMSLSRGVAPYARSHPSNVFVADHPQHQSWSAHRSSRLPRGAVGSTQSLVQAQEPAALPEPSAAPLRRRFATRSSPVGRRSRVDRDSRDTDSQSSLGVRLIALAVRSRLSRLRQSHRPGC
jgi:hypothetical protein